MRNMFQRSQVEIVEIENTSSVTTMESMFAYAKKLKDGNFSDWDTSKVKNFSFMFRGASQFNQDLSRWNTESATTMQNMFDGASQFNQDLSNWNLSSASNLDGFIWSDNSFEQDNYEKFLEKLEASNLDPTTMESRTIHVSSTYCAAASLRNKLTARGFDLKDN